VVRGGMTDELLAYLLDDLCPERRAEIDRRLASDPALRRELERIQECLSSSDDAKSCVDEPPGDLVTRTCCLVTRIPAEGAAAVGLSSCGATASCASRWSLTDYGVCAGVLGVLAMLMAPALRESRDAARRQVCSNNLRALGTAVFNYARVHGRELPPLSPDEPVSAFTADLVDRLGVDPVQLAESMRCPDSPTIDAQLASAAAHRVPGRRDLRLHRATALKQLQACSRGIAIQAGYTDQDGVYHCAKFNARRGRPFAADAPTFTPSGIVIMVHGGQGVNVLEEGISVRFQRSMYWQDGEEHIFANSDGMPEAGHDSQDVVLIRGDYLPVPQLQAAASLD